MNIPTTFLLAIAAIESGNDNSAVGRNGEIGALQIGWHAWIDANAQLITESVAYWHCLDDMHSAYASHVTARAYLRRYCTADRLGREPTLIAAARIWHGGPNGHLKPHTIPYANRVMNLYAQYEAEQLVDARAKLTVTNP